MLPQSVLMPLAMLVLQLVLVDWLLNYHSANGANPPHHRSNHRHRHTSLQQREAEFTSSNRSEVVAFWNIYAGGEYFADINKEQRFVMESSGLMDRLDIVYYTTIGSNGSSYRMPGAKMKHLHFHGRWADEANTQQLLYRYCHKNPQSKVLYFHNKGSFNYHITNTNFRKSLDCFVLNPRCIDQLDSFDTCGWRISMVPHVHYSGNYWWATCRHINRLLPPLTPQRNQTFLRVTSAINPLRRSPTDYTFHDYPNLGLGRFFAETWVGSLPNFSVADCLSSEDNHDYLGGYTLPWILVNDACPSWKPEFADMVRRYDAVANSLQSALPPPTTATTHASGILSYTNASGSSGAPEAVPRLSYGLTCAASAVCYQPERFRGDEAVQRVVREFAHYAAPIVQRTLLWYGEKPVLYSAWMKAILGDDPVPTKKKRKNGDEDMRPISHALDSAEVEAAARAIAMQHNGGRSSDGINTMRRNATAMRHDAVRRPAGHVGRRPSSSWSATST